MRAVNSSEARAGATCELGDVFEYMRSLNPGEPARPSRTASAQVVAALERLRPGDVLAVPAGRRGGRRGDGEVAVLSISQRKRGELSLRAITAERRLVSYSSRDFRSPPRVLGRLELPLPFAPRSRDFQRRVAAGLVVARGLSGGGQAPRAGGAPAEAGHPVSVCPELRAHLRAAARAVNASPARSSGWNAR